MRQKLPVSPAEPIIPCTWQESSRCAECQISGKLQCRLDKRDMTRFFLIFMPFAVAAIAGTIRAGYGWALWLWLAYGLFFFFVWEARILCRHCPFWAGKSGILRCHANYGVVKLWKYHPGPMTRLEKMQFLVGGLILIAFPFPAMLLGHQYLFALITACTATSFALLLRLDVCVRCVNFSCPLNAVPKSLVDAYLINNPAILKAWIDGGPAPTELKIKSQ